MSPMVRTVMGISGEPATPTEPAKGRVWSAIVDQIDRPRSESEYVSVADTDRNDFRKHPWSLQGGGASELTLELQGKDRKRIETLSDSIGFASFPGLEDAFVGPREALHRFGIPSFFIKPYMDGESVRDWEAAPNECAFAPYNTDLSLLPLEPTQAWAQRLWLNRRSLGAVVSFGGKTRVQLGESWWSWYRWIPAKYQICRSITFAEVATHNHFAFDRGGNVFNQTAPVIKLRSGASDEDHTGLSGLLNSSLAGFWLMQVCHRKGGSRSKDGARVKTEVWTNQMQFNSTKVGQFPVAVETPGCLSGKLERLASESFEHSPGILTARDTVSAAALAEAEHQAAALRARMISLQEELDWQCYRHYGLVTRDDLEWPEDRLDALPALTLGERAFEIRMARQMVAGELETTWFERHKDAGSKPITELPAHWPDDYRALVERRLAFIESNKYINLIERPEYKRRWNTEPWAERQQEALRRWLLLRLEGYFFDSDRMFEKTTDHTVHTDNASEPDSIRAIREIVVPSPEVCVRRLSRSIIGRTGSGRPAVSRSGGGLHRQPRVLGPQTRS
jgi:hypothetical protein